MTTDRFDAAYTERFPLFGSDPTASVVTLAELIPAAGEILDLGCGDGRDSLWLLGRGFNVRAIDKSAVAIQRLQAEAQRRGLIRQLEAIAEDVTEVRIPLDSYDGGVCITLLDHLYRDSMSRVLEEFMAGIRPGGHIAIQVHSDRDPGCICGPGAPGVSEFASEIKTYFRANELLERFLSGWRVLSYADRLEYDTDHGPVHTHGFMSIIAQKDTRS